MAITPNERETIAAVDSISGASFYVEGTSSTGAINVNLAGSVGTLDSNLTEIDGTAVAVNTGNANNGTQRVVLASDQPDVDTHEQTGMVPIVYDAITYTATSGTVDTYQYYTGGTGGTLVATLTVTYTDSTHNTLVSSVRT